MRNTSCFWPYLTHGFYGENVEYILLLGNTWQEVKRLNESGKKTRGKIQATKKWLTRAEEHFGRDASVRGEMDLLLAEAELRSTREKLQTGRYRSLWLQHGLALGAAFTIMAFGVGGAWLFWRDAPALPVVAKPPAVIAPTALPSPLPSPLAAAPAKRTEETPPAAAALPTNPGQEVNTSNKPVTQDKPVSPDEMKRLVRTAGQSLRGQSRP